MKHQIQGIERRIENVDIQRQGFESGIARKVGSIEDLFET